MLLLNYAFNTLNMRKICSAVFAFNGRSQAYNRKCGYRVEGVSKKHVFVRGNYCDLVMMALFKEDWQPLWEKFKKRGRL
jgi:RimJ/RimL family protein N-acetyltransferase